MAGLCTRFGCNTTLNPDGDPTIHDTAWGWSVTSLAGVLSLLVFVQAVHSHSRPSLGTTTRATVVCTAAAALLPLVWTPVVVLTAATPDCRDEVLVHDRYTPHLTMPNGDLALTTDGTLVDEATRAMAFGVLLLGGGSSLLSLFVLAQYAGIRGWCGDHSLNITRLHSVVAFLATVLYTAGGAEMHRKTTQHVSWRWSKEDFNEDRVRDECNAGSGAVFGRPFGPTDRDTFFRLITAGFSASALAVSGCIITAGISLALRPSAVSMHHLRVGCAILCLVAHTLNTVVLSEAVFIGSNPQCTEYILATNRRAGNGVLTATFGLALVALYMIAIACQPDVPVSKSPALPSKDHALNTTASREPIFTAGPTPTHRGSTANATVAEHAADWKDSSPSGSVGRSGTPVEPISSTVV